MPTLYTFMLAEAEELVRREAGVAAVCVNRDQYLGALLQFERMRQGLAMAGLLDLRQAHYVGAILKPVLQRYWREEGM